MKMIRKIAATGTATLVATTGVMVAVAGPAHAEASGTVTCPSGPVVGVWVVHDDDAKSGWAWTPNDGSSTQPYLRKELGENESYKLHIGCGTKENGKWKKTYKSDWGVGNRDVTCFPMQLFSSCVG